MQRGWTLKQLGEYLECSSRSVQRRIHKALKQPVPVVSVPSSGVLVLDATWNHREWCLLLYRDAGGLVLTHRFDTGEKYEGYLDDLTRLKTTGYQPKAIVSDGHNALLKAIRQVFPGVPQQRCLLHLQRQCLLWLTQHPKTLAGQSLRYIVIQLLQVESNQEAEVWNVLFDSWCELFQDVLQEKTFATYPANPTNSTNIHQTTLAQSKQRNWWYTHRSLRKAWRLLKNAKPHLWLWLAQTDVPKTTNLLEGGINAPIKRLLHRHSGLRTDRQKNTIAWWIFFRNNP